MPDSQQQGFTLIELLVVVTIIVIIVSLLTPALDRAVYRAELVGCAGRLKALGTTVTLYTQDFQRQYPYRPRARASSGARPEEIRVVPPAGTVEVDDRDTLRPYMSIQKGMQCPMVRPANMETENPLTQVFSSYQHWYGWQFGNSELKNRGMFRLGDAFTYQGDAFTTLASDSDFHDNAQSGYVQSAHPDREGGTANITLNDVFSVWGNYTSSWWIGTAGTTDRSFAFADGSVGTAFGLTNDDSANTLIGEDGQSVVRISTRCNEVSNGPQTTFLPVR